MSVPDSETFMRMLQDREKVLAAILADMSTCAANAESLGKLEALLESGSAIDQRKALLALAKSGRHVNESHRRALLILLTYTGSETFGTDAARILNKMGRGVEALREMMKQKMGGR